MEIVQLKSFQIICIWYCIPFLSQKLVTIFFKNLFLNSLFHFPTHNIISKSKTFTFLLRLMPYCIRICNETCYIDIVLSCETSLNSQTVASEGGPVALESISTNFHIVPLLECSSRLTPCSPFWTLSKFMLILCGLHFIILHLLNMLVRNTCWSF